MKGIMVVLVVLSLTFMAVSAGCSQAAPPGAVQAAPAPSLTDIALTAADAPANYTYAGSRIKTADEIGDLAKSLGWQDGFVVRFTGMTENPAGTTEIVQTITTYPEKSMPEIVTLVDTNDRADPELAITILPPPGFGENSHAFIGSAGLQIVMQGNSDNPMISASRQDRVGQDMVEIIFARGSTLEVMKMTGPDADYATLSALAEKAYAKLP
jgi:HAMP domain-containing protein